MCAWICGLQGGQKERKGQKADECMHVNWNEEQEKEEEMHQAAIVVIFDSKMLIKSLLLQNKTVMLAAITGVDCDKNAEIQPISYKGQCKQTAL